MRTSGTSCSAGSFGLAELGVCAPSKTYLEQFAISDLICRPSFRAPTLKPTPPGVLPPQAGTATSFSSNTCQRSMTDRPGRRGEPTRKDRAPLTFGAASADADAPCDEDCNRAAARLQRRGPILSAVTTDGRKTMTTTTSMKQFGYA